MAEGRVFETHSAHHGTHRFQDELGAPVPFTLHIGKLLFVQYVTQGTCYPSHLRTSLRLPVETLSFNSQRGQKRNIYLLTCLSAFYVATFLYDGWLRVKDLNLKPYESESSALPFAPTLIVAEERGFEPPDARIGHRRFSKPLP